MQIKLVVAEGKANKPELKLKLPAIVGRSREATLTVAHPKVSRKHCELYELDGALVVRDNGSLNGTFVDGQQVTESVVPPGGRITIGPLTFVANYEHAGVLPSLAPAAPAGADETDFVALIEQHDEPAEEPPPQVDAETEKEGAGDSESTDARIPSEPAWEGEPADETPPAATPQPAAAADDDEMDFDFMADDDADTSEVAPSQLAGRVDATGVDEPSPAANGSAPAESNAAADDDDFDFDDSAVEPTAANENLAAEAAEDEEAEDEEEDEAFKDFLRDLGK